MKPTPLRVPRARGNQAAAHRRRPRCKAGGAAGQDKGNKTNRPTDRHTAADRDRETDRQTDRQADKHMARRTCRRALAVATPMLSGPVRAIMRCLRCPLWVRYHGPSCRQPRKRTTKRGSNSSKIHVVTPDWRRRQTVRRSAVVAADGRDGGSPSDEKWRRRGRWQAMGPVTAAAMHADDSDERWPDRRQQRTDTARKTRRTGEERQAHTHAHRNTHTTNVH